MINFPNAPTPGQIYTASGASWAWDGVKWTAASGGSTAYAPLASPALSGNPTSPTPATADNDTSIATTAYVQAQGYATSAAMTTADNLRVLKAGDTMTGALTVAAADVNAANFMIGGQLTGNAGTIGFANSNGPSVQFWGTGTAGAGALQINTSGTERFRLTPAGVCTLGAAFNPSVTNALPIGSPTFSWSQVNAYAYVTTSDASLKQDFAPVPAGALARVEALSPLTYRFKDGTDTARRHHGFLAGEVRDALGADFGGYVEAEESGIAGIAYAELTAVLWRAVQELSAKVAALEGKPAEPASELGSPA